MIATSEAVRARSARRKKHDALFRVLCIAMTGLGMLILAVLLVQVARQGAGWLKPHLFTNWPSRFPEKAGLKSALFGTLWVVSFTALISIPVGVAAAIFLEEFVRRNRLTRIIEVNISNLAGVPSIVYGILGLAVFVRGIGLGRSIVAGSLTLSLLIMPVIILASRESIRAVPGSIRQAAFALGATRWQTVRHHVLPAALPGVITGIILATSRAIGETAPLIMVGALSYVAFVPQGPMDGFTTLPIQIFNWAARPQEDFHHLAGAGIIVLLAVLLLMNGIAYFVRYRSQRKYRW